MRSGVALERPSVKRRQEGKPECRKKIHGVERTEQYNMQRGRATKRKNQPDCREAASKETGNTGSVRRCTTSANLIDFAFTRLDACATFEMQARIQIELRGNHFCSADVLFCSRPSEHP